MTRSDFFVRKTKNIFSTQRSNTLISASASSRPEWVRRVDTWGREGRPFLLLADFELAQVRTFPLDEIDPHELRYQFHDRTNHLAAPFAPMPDLDWQPHFVAESDYRRAFERVARGLRRGDSFLTNLTFPTEVATNWDLEQIYRYTQARYKLWWKDHFVLFSPESFVRIKNDKIYTFPMKGTLPAYLPGEQLLKDAKERAEHATIVDLMRNDLSRVASKVSVESYRYLERIATPAGGLWQTSSRIAGTLASDYTSHLGELLYQLLPAGSISGAPKVETVNIIREAEQRKRGYYTGVAALWDGHELDSCVMIRFIEQGAEGLRYWSGGGITAYSNWREEYRELREKVYLPVRTAETVDLSVS